MFWQKNKYNLEKMNKEMYENIFFAADKKYISENRLKRVIEIYRQNFVPKILHSDNHTPENRKLF